MANLKCNGTIEATNVVVNGSNVLTLENYLNSVYPVGSIYMSVNNTNPGTLFGGTWSAWGAGRVPVGIGSNGETNYTTAEATGGSENSVATHTHTQNSHSHTVTVNTNNGSVIVQAKTGGTSFIQSGSGFVSYTTDNGGTSGGSLGTSSTDVSCDTIYFNHNHSASSGSVTATNNNTGTTGGNRQPYITCYMWKRIG